MAQANREREGTSDRPKKTRQIQSAGSAAAQNREWGGGQDASCASHHQGCGEHTPILSDSHQPARMRSMLKGAQGSCLALDCMGSQIPFGSKCPISVVTAVTDWVSNKASSPL